ncbi:MAG: winged helix-turn-helix domain-containing protein [Candidatus Pacebacteria bacterium]|nr:winged helix-turn-helix domain-containing protein [Candidatus Paceibacterota bacterium]
MDTFILILVGAVGIIFGYSMSRAHMRAKLAIFANTERAPGKQKKKNVLLKHLHDHGKLTNAEAQELLGVSDTTVVVYFDELEAEGKVVQVGETGRGVHYTLAN